jgi:hypothetical protein
VLLEIRASTTITVVAVKLWVVNHFLLWVVVHWHHHVFLRHCKIETSLVASIKHMWVHWLFDSFYIVPSEEVVALGVELVVLGEFRHCKAHSFLWMDLWLRN